MATSPTMYKLLVQDPNDVLAALAYTAYKQHEVEVMDGILLATGVPATQSDIDAFYNASSVPTMLAMYEQQAEALMNAFLEETLESRKNALESEFASTKIALKLQAIQDKQNEKKGWTGWAADVSGNLAVNFATILIIAALLFGYRGLDEISGAISHHFGVLNPNASKTENSGQTAPATALPAAVSPNKLRQ